MSDQLQVVQDAIQADQFVTITAEGDQYLATWADHKVGNAEVAIGAELNTVSVYNLLIWLEDQTETQTTKTGKTRKIRKYAHRMDFDAVQGMVITIGKPAKIAKPRTAAKVKRLLSGKAGLYFRVDADLAYQLFVRGKNGSATVVVVAEITGQVTLPDGTPYRATYHKMQDVRWDASPDNMVAIDAWIRSQNNGTTASVSYVKPELYWSNAR